MHHPIEESPEEDVGEEPPHQAPGEQQPPGLEALVPAASGLQDEQQRQEERGQEVEDESVEAGEAQDAGGGSGQRRHRRAAVVEHGRVAPHRHLTDELGTLALGYDPRHLSPEVTWTMR